MLAYIPASGRMGRLAVGRGISLVRASDLRLGRDVPSARNVDHGSGTGSLGQALICASAPALAMVADALLSDAL